MLWKTHIRIGREVLKRLGVSLTHDVYDSFREGLITPDKQRGKYEKHHECKSAEIADNLMKARRYFLQDDLPSAYFHLGIALHYIQDSYTSVVSYDSPMNQIWHQNYEQNIEDSSFICDVERAIEYSFRDNYSQRNKYSTLAMNLSEKVEGKDSTLRAATLIGEYQSSQTGKPRIDLNVALMASLAVTDSVLGPKTCTALETQLKDLLVQHEAFLRNAEVETSNDVIRLIEERDLLINERNPPTGMVSKIKNWVIGLRISFKNRAAKAKTRAYLLRRHLENVASRYQVATQEAVNPSIGWYNFQVSRINIDAARKNLLSLQEIGGSLGMNELSVKELLKKGNVQSYSVGNNELVKRLELDRVLGQFPINGFKKYPA